MSSRDAMLAEYEAVASTVGEMLYAARRADWCRFDVAARQCAALTRRIGAMGDPSHVLDAPGRRARHRILLRVLRDDAAIRAITEAPAWQRTASQRIDASRFGDAHAS